jgi:hypothetical protein
MGKPLLEGRARNRESSIREETIEIDANRKSVTAGATTDTRVGKGGTPV